MGTSVYVVQLKLQSTVLFTFHGVWFVAVIAEGLVAMLVAGSPLRQSGFDYRVL